MVLKSCISPMMTELCFIPCYVVVLNKRAIKRSFQNRNPIYGHSEVCVNVALPLTQEHMISTQKQPYSVHSPAFLNSFCPREAFMLSEAVRREVNLNNISEIIMIKQIFICFSKFTARSDLLQTWVIYQNKVVRLNVGYRHIKTHLRSIWVIPLGSHTLTVE